MLRQITSLFSLNCLFPSHSVIEDEPGVSFRKSYEKGGTTDKHKEHPLLNTLVVHELFKYLEFSILLKCREVCTTWDKEACRMLKKSSKHRRIPNQRLKAFLQVFHKSGEDFPLRNYSLKSQELDKSHQIFLHSLGYSGKISSLMLSIPVNELPTVVQFAKPLTCLKYLRLTLNSERTIKDCPLFSLQSKNSILLSKKSLPNLISISIRNGEPEKRIFCNYDYYMITLINSAYSLVDLEFHSWAVSSRLLREIYLEHIQSLKILGNPLSETDIHILSKKKINSLKLVELFVDNNVNDNVFEEFVRNMHLKNSLISISTSTILNS